MPVKGYRKRAKKLDEEEAQVLEAVNAIKTGVYKNAYDAARAMNMESKRMTIHRRLTGRAQERRYAHAGQQILTPVQEGVLVEWLKWLAATGHPCSKRTIAPKVRDLSGRQPSRRWIRSFLMRHSDLVLGRPNGLDPKRAKAFNFYVVNHHFKLLQTQFDLTNIPLRNLYNVDEIGVQLGGGRNGASKELFFYSEKDRNRYKLKSDDLELITVLETVCADGTAPIKPCFVFKGKLFCQEWFTVDPEILTATTDTGWTNDEIYKTWFKNSFLPQAKAHSDPNFPIILIYDGHGSHSTLPVVRAALEDNVTLFCLPPHTTHRLQPCDVGAFGPFKIIWQQMLREYYEQQGVFLPIRDFVKVYMQARSVAFKAETIKHAWRRAGIDVSSTSPRTNPSIFKVEDFLTSVSSSTTLQLPQSYPILVSEDEEPIFVASDSSSEDGEDDDTSFDIDYSTPSTSLPSQSSTIFPVPDIYKSDTEDENYDPGYLGDSDEELTDNDRPDAFMSDTSDEEDYEGLSHEALVRKLRKYKTRYKGSKGVIGGLETRIEVVEAHSTLAANHIGQLQGQLNAKKKHSKSGKDRNVHILSRIVTSEEGAQEAEKQDAERKQREAEEQAKQQRKDDAAAVLRATRTAGQGNLVFDQPLSKLLAPDLRNLLWNLMLDETGTVTEMRDRLKAHFNDNEDLKTDPRYIKLFPGRGTRKRPLPTVETVDPVTRPISPSLPSPQRRRFSSMSVSSVPSSSRIQLQDMTNQPLPPMHQYIPDPMHFSDMRPQPHYDHQLMYPPPPPPHYQPVGFAGQYAHIPPAPHPYYFNPPSL